MEQLLEEYDKTHWNCEKYRQYAECEDDWADPRAAFGAAVLASPVYKLLAFKRTVGDSGEVQKKLKGENTRARKISRFMSCKNAYFRVQ